jgi:hypothetical protein
MRISIVGLVCRPGVVMVARLSASKSEIYIGPLLLSALEAAVCGYDAGCRMRSL